MDIRSIFVTNGVGIVILLMLSFISRTKILRRREEDRIYSFMILGAILGCVMETASYVIDGRVFPGSVALNYVFNTYLYTFNLLLPFAVLAYVDIGLYGDPGRIRTKYRPQIVVGAAMLAVNVLNLFVPLSFSIGPDNVYHRGPLSYVYYAVILYYLFSAMAVTRRYEKENGARAFFNIHVFLIPIIVGAGLQFLVYGLSLAWLSAAVGLTGMFMMQQNEIGYIDALVDAYNRQYLNHILSSWINRGVTFSGVMLDVDRFKAINDAFGHSEGDRVLRDLAAILKASRTRGELVFRFAGDEFIVLGMADSEDGLAPYLEALDRNLAAYNQEDHRCPLSVSYGTSFFRTGRVDDFIKEMDSRMYEMKARHHGGARPAEG